VFGRLESNGNNPLPVTWNSTCQPMATEVSADATSQLCGVRDLSSNFEAKLQARLGAAALNGNELRSLTRHVPL
jgi:hypothetical protein